MFDTLQEQHLMEIKITCMYIYIGSYTSTSAKGMWKNDIIPVSCSMTRYEVWNDPHPKLFTNQISSSISDVLNIKCDGNLSDNKMTVSAPAIAKSEISVGAYTTKNQFQHQIYDDWMNAVSNFSISTYENQYIYS